MLYTIFYNIEAIGQVVDSSQPETCGGEDTYLDLLSALSTEGDYFGLIDRNGSCLQVMYSQELSQYWIEIPRKDLFGSIGKYYKFEEAKIFLHSLPDEFPIDGFVGFNFEKW